MTVVSILLFALWQFLIPVAVGTLFAKVNRSRLFGWVCGQTVIWAGFQVLATGFIVMGQSFSYVVYATVGYVSILLLTAVILGVKRGRQLQETTAAGQVPADACRRIIVLGILAGALLLFQLIMTVCMAYEEGDDAYYLALSTTTANDNTMYYKNAYTGYYTELDIRHGLAPFPMWIAFLSRMTGMVPITMAQVVLPVGLILMAYGIYYLLGQRLFAGQKEKALVFLTLTEVLVICGGYSLYSAENFLLVRISQGKAVLANIILPFMVFVYLLLLERFHEDQGISKEYWILLGTLTLSGCLCSTQGGLIVCLSLALLGICVAVGYRKWKVLIPLGLAGCFPVVYMLLYLIMG